MSDDFSDVAAKAEARGRKILASEPRARSARYNARTGQVIVRLTNGCGFSFPARKVQGLER